MNKEIKTISDLIDAVVAEMVRLDYKPTVVKQYHIVWNKLRKTAGEQPASDFDMDFGMSFLEEAMRTHFKHLNDNSGHRWRKAIYLLSDYKRTGIITLRKNKREYVYAENVRKPIQLYIAHLEAIGRSTAHITPSLSRERASRSYKLLPYCRCKTRYGHCCFVASIS